MAAPKIASKSQKFTVLRVSSLKKLYFLSAWNVFWNLSRFHLICSLKIMKSLYMIIKKNQLIDNIAKRVRKKTSYSSFSVILICLYNIYLIIYMYIHTYIYIKYI